MIFGFFNILLDIRFESSYSALTHPWFQHSALRHNQCIHVTYDLTRVGAKASVTEKDVQSFAQEKLSIASSARNK